MRVLVLGGTGGIGPFLIEELLAASHTLVIYARSPQKLPDSTTSNSQVTVVKGELTDEEALKHALLGGGEGKERVDAVVSCLGPPVSRGPLYPSGTPLAKAYKVLLEIMHATDVKRLIALGTASNKDEHDKFDLAFKTLVLGVAVGAHHAYEDVVAIGNAIRGTPKGELLWTLIRVPILTNGESKEYYAGYVGDGKTKTFLPRVAFAVFVVDELARNDWINKAPLLSST